MLTGHDIYLFKEGSHSGLYRELGCHLDPAGGATFAVWAPNASEVSVIGEWNGWRPGTDMLAARWDQSGIWEARVPAVKSGQSYKYRITARDGRATDKADPFAFYAEMPPARASRAWPLDNQWNDGAWMSARAAHNALNAPVSIYEAHLGSWRRGENDRLLGYREVAPMLAEYVA